MFPWEKKQGPSYSKQQAYAQNQNIDVRDFDNSQENYIDHLPSINNPKYSHERGGSYQPQNAEEFQQMPEMQYNQGNQGGRESLYSRSRSYSPFVDRNDRNVIQKKTYARILDEQIQSRNAKKASERQRSIEMDKRILETDHFYKHFGRNHIADRYRENAFLPQIDYSVYGRNNEPNKSSITQRGQPLRTDANSSFGDYAVTNQSGVRYVDDGMEPGLDNKTKEYLKKIEYKQALEQQILEQNLRKRHEKEMRLLEDKIDELKSSQPRPRVKTGKDVPSYEKLAGLPILVNGSELYLKPVLERNTASSKVAPGQRRYIPPPPHEINTRLKPIIRTNKYAADYSNELLNEMQNKGYIVDNGTLSNYFYVQNELGKIKHDIKDHMTKMNDKLADLRSELATYSTARQNRDLLQYQILKDGAALIPATYKNGDPYLQVPTIDQVINSSESKNSLSHESQFVPVGDMILDTPYAQYTLVPDPDYSLKPLLENMTSVTKMIEQSIYNQQQKFERDLSTIKQELRLFKKNEEEVQMEKLHEYVSLVGNFVDSTRKLEQNLNVQQQKLHRELATIQNELRAYKITEEEIRTKKYNEYAPLIEDMVTLTKKLERSLNSQQQKLNTELGTIQRELRGIKMRDYEPIVPVVPIKLHMEPKMAVSEPTPDKTELLDNLSSLNSRPNPATNYYSDSVKTKTRKKSHSVRHNKRGIKRIRDELPGEGQKLV